MPRRLRLILGIVLAAVPLVAPGPEFTWDQRKMASVALLMAAWWITEAIPIPATALLPLALFPLLGVLPSKQTASAYGDHLVFLFLGGFLIASAMERWNLHRRIAVFTIGLLGAGPRRIMLGFMVATAFLSMWISNTATTLMMVPIAAAVVKQLAGNVQDPDQKRRVTGELGAVLMLALAYSASIGGIGTLVGTPPNIVFSGFYTRLLPDAPEISFSQWMLVGIPFVVVALPIAFLVVWRFGGSVPLDLLQTADSGSLIREEKRKLGPMTGPEKLVLVIFALTALLWITRKSIDLGGVTVPGWSVVFPWQSSIHDATVAMGMALLLFILPVRPPGESRLRPALNWEEAVGKIPWGILLLFGGGFALAAGFRETGLDGWLGGQLTQLTKAPVVVLVLATCLLSMLLTEVTSNTATTTLLMPILASAADGAQLPPILLMLPAALAASCAFMLPVATPPNAIVFGTGWLTIPRMARTGVLLNFITAILITILVMTLGRGVFEAI